MSETLPGLKLNGAFYVKMADSQSSYLLSLSILIGEKARDQQSLFGSAKFINL